MHLADFPNLNKCHSRVVTISNIVRLPSILHSVVTIVGPPTMVENQSTLLIYQIDKLSIAVACWLSLQILLAKCMLAIAIAIRENIFFVIFSSSVIAWWPSCLIVNCSVNSSSV